MIGFIIRCLVAALALFFNVYLFATGYWGWGISMIFIVAIIGLSFFRNENMILALNQMRVGNQDKAKKYINKITAPQFLPKSQRAYVLYLQAMFNVQDWGFAKTEATLRESLNLGLRQAQDQAMTKLQLAGICAQTGRINESKTLLAEAKKLDKDKMLKEQIDTMGKQMMMVGNKNQMRMAMMHKGRVKTPRNKSN